MVVAGCNFVQLYNSLFGEKVLLFPFPFDIYFVLLEKKSESDQKCFLKAFLNLL